MQNIDCFAPRPALSPYRVSSFLSSPLNSHCEFGQSKSAQILLRPWSHNLQQLPCKHPTIIMPIPGDGDQESHKLSLSTSRKKKQKPKPLPPPCFPCKPHVVDKYLLLLASDKLSPIATIHTSCLQPNFRFEFQSHQSVTTNQGPSPPLTRHSLPRHHHQISQHAKILRAPCSGYLL